MVADHLSLKKLQKEVLGIQGRGEPTGISVFKSWSALEDRAKLLWTNAYFYNEEGSEIYDLAQELEVCAASPHGFSRVSLTSIPRKRSTSF